LSAAFVKELRRKRSPTWVDIVGKTDDFAHLVGRGAGDISTGWLEIDEDKAIRELPSLFPLVPIIVGDGTGGFGAKVQQNLTLKDALSPLIVDLRDGPLARLIATPSIASSRFDGSSGPRP
jgi:hypothetical protein